jgi:hypothetical protein
MGFDGVGLCWDDKVRGDKLSSDEENLTVVYFEPSVAPLEIGFAGD